MRRGTVFLTLLTIEEDDSYDGLTLFSCTGTKQVQHGILKWKASIPSRREMDNRDR